MPKKTSPKNKLTIRKATLKDLDAFWDLEQAAFRRERFSRRQFAYLLSKAKALPLLALDGKTPAGYALYTCRTHIGAARLYSLAIHPAYRGQGIATRLMTLAEKRLKKDHDHLYLEVRKDNRKAIRLYKQNGFDLLRTVPGYYEDGTDALKMIKAL